MNLQENKLLLNECQSSLSKLGLDFVVKNALQLTQGVNNTCFKAQTMCENTLVIKHFDKQDNFKVTEVEKSLAKINVVPKIVALNAAEKLIAYQFIEHKDFDKNHHLPSLIAKLKKLHQLKLDYDFDTINIEHTFKGFTDLQEFADYQNDVIELNAKLRAFKPLIGVCHNDLVKENLLFSTSDSWIIDFEYVGLNDVYFDLAALSSSLKLSEQEKKQLLSMYFEQFNISEEQLEKLNLYQKVYNLICYFWYLKHGFTSHALALKPFIND
ncbi:phosphotransferase [Pseudoalteromonas sp. SSM20]|uniref:phosphotransferase n=1 Tax=Pseudoalteromonas sp. SSM20 TaxID=3139394 RepID=UPI003BAB1745